MPESTKGNGYYLLRIEDIDTPRVQASAAETIMQQLHTLGLAWDGALLWQSQRDAA